VPPDYVFRMQEGPELDSNEIKPGGYPNYRWAGWTVKCGGERPVRFHHASRAHDTLSSAGRSITHKDADELLAALSSIVAAAFGPMLPTTFWVRHGQPAIQRYLHSCGVGVKAPEIPVLPNMSEPFTEPAPDKAPTPTDNVVSFSPGAASRKRTLAWERGGTDMENPKRIASVAKEPAALRQRRARSRV